MLPYSLIEENSPVRAFLTNKKLIDNLLLDPPKNVQVLTEMQQKRSGITAWFFETPIICSDSFEENTILAIPENFGTLNRQPETDSYDLSLFYNKESPISIVKVM